MVCYATTSTRGPGANFTAWTPGYPLMGLVIIHVLKCACVVIVTADVPYLPVHSLHNVGNHHHATQALLDASFVFNDVSTCIQAGTLTLSVRSCICM